MNKNKLIRKLTLIAHCSKPQLLSAAVNPKTHISFHNMYLPFWSYWCFHRYCSLPIGILSWPALPVDALKRSFRFLQPPPSIFLGMVGAMLPYHLFICSLTANMMKSYRPASMAGYFTALLSLDYILHTAFHSITMAAVISADWSDGSIPATGEVLTQPGYCKGLNRRRRNSGWSHTNSMKHCLHRCCASAAHSKCNTCHGPITKRKLRSISPSFLKGVTECKVRPWKADESVMMKGWLPLTDEDKSAQRKKTANTAQICCCIGDQTGANFRQGKDLRNPTSNPIL